jgi:6-phosphogluconolactonase/glucosamine-6-phosphate isomerase/deaminase
MEHILHTLQQIGKLPLQKDNLNVLQVKDQTEGLLIAEKLLYATLDNKTVFFASGGSTPKGLFEAFVKSKQLTLGAIGMVDERYGQPFHAISNEKMIADTGLFSYCTQRNIPVCTALQEGKSREEDAKLYEDQFKTLIKNFPKKIALLGMGVDGHIAGIAPNRQDFINPLYTDAHATKYVGEFKDSKPMSKEGNPSPPNGFGERITLTFKGLEQMDVLFLLAFGENKKEAFQRMFLPGSNTDVPARFLVSKKIAPKVLVITDQEL